MSNKLQTLKGFRDFLPEEAKTRAWLKSKMIEVFEKWGYEPLETPTLEPLELFEGEIGEDEKLFFKFEDRGGRKVALRYDQTVPTCRVLGQYYNNFVFPFRRYQIQPAFRSEKPQKGRYREFVQADIDIFGITSPLADAECIAVGLDMYISLGFKNVVVLINNRNLLKDIPYPVIATIDKLKKLGENGVLIEIQNKGYTKKQAKEYLETVKNLKPDETLKIIFEYLKKSGFSTKNYKYEPTLARSFSYSEGPIWEIIIPEYEVKSLGGSVGGGERYDEMLKRITNKKIAGTGIAFGFDRTLEAMKVCNLLPKFKSTSKVLVTVFSPEFLEKSLEIAKTLRENNINCEVYPDENTRLDKQLKYADKKQIPYAIIVGSDEKEKKTIILKNLQNRTQQELSEDQLTKIKLPL